MKTHPLKKFFAKIAYKKGRGAAINATARKLATIIYHMLTKKQEFNPQYYQQQEQNQRLKNIIDMKRKMSNLNLTEQEIAQLLDLKK